MTRMLRSRISRRVLTEHHIALSSQFRSPRRQHDSERFVGIVDSQLEVAQLISRCAGLATGDNVAVELDGSLEEKFAYIHEHLECVQMLREKLLVLTKQLSRYMVFELLKNSARATLDRHGASSASHPIRVTVVASPRDLIIRISDSGQFLSRKGKEKKKKGGLLISLARVTGGGIPPIEPLADNLSASRHDVFSFLFSLSSTPAGRASLGKLKSVERLGGTVREQVERSLDINVDVGHDRLGIGLPLSRIYADYFGMGVHPQLSFLFLTGCSDCSLCFLGDRREFGDFQSARPRHRCLPAHTEAGHPTRSILLNIYFHRENERSHCATFRF
jgi:pyruvate dehydrogenase kinase 2/3/4